MADFPLRCVIFAAQVFISMNVRILFVYILHFVYLSFIWYACICSTQLDTSVYGVCYMFRIRSYAQTSLYVRLTQIRKRLWVRNGPMMLSQEINYSEPSTCKMFFDRDLFLLQFSGCLMGDTDFFTTQLLYRYELLHVFSLPPTTTAATASVGTNGAATSPQVVGTNSSDIESSAPMSAELTLPPYPDITLLEEALVLLIQLITELPLPPTTVATERYTPILRREVIHRLASSPATYSQLHEILHRIDPASVHAFIDLDAIIRDASYSKGTSALEAPKQHLKPECWTEYDPAYYHLTSAAHLTIAATNRPKVRATSSFI